MSATEKKQDHYVGYEYKELEANGEMLPLLLDGYENFGWKLNEKLSGNDRGGKPGSRRKAVIRMKRDRKIVNKMELTRLQRNFEACVVEIQILEKRKTSAATLWALVVGIIGTAFMAGSTFAVTSKPPHIISCIVLAVPGFLGWILPYFLYRKIVERETGKVTPLIETKYDEIYEICGKGSKLLYYDT